MAYKSQVTNKYMGSGFKGAPKSNTTTELTQIVKALKEDFNPAFKNYVDTYIDKKQDDAAIKVQGLYASGMTADAISKEILDGKHPDLEGKYVKAVVDGYAGTFEAGEVIKKINEAKAAGEYSIEDGISIETFWKGHLPKFTDKSSAWTTGFATIFNKYKATELQEDAKLRGEFRESKKVEGIHGVIDAHIITENAAKKKVKSSDLWAIMNSYIADLPKVDGYKENQFISKETANKAMYEYAYKLYTDAETQEDLEIAKSIIYDKRVDAKGNELDSLFSIGKKETVQLLGSIEKKMITLENQRYQNDERAYVSERRDLLINIINADNEEEKKKFLKTLEETHPDLYTTYNQIVIASGKVNEQSGEILKLTEEVMKGEWNNKDGLLEEAKKYGATESTITSLLKEQINAEKNSAYGWENPYEDKDVSELNAKLAVILKGKIPALAKYDDGKVTQMIVDRVEKDVRAEYIEWIKKDKNKRPDKTANPEDQLKWFEKKEKWINAKYEEKLKIYDNDAWLTSFKNLMELEEEAGFDLEAVPTEYYNAVVKDVVEQMKVINPTDNTSEIQKYQIEADRDLMSIADVIANSQAYRELINDAGFKSLIAQNPEFGETIIAEIMEGLGLETKDYSEQLSVLSDTIGAFTDTITLPSVVENKLLTWGNEKTESIEAQNLAFKQGLETILGREATQGLLWSIKEFKPESITALAQIFNMSSEDFGQMVNKTLGNK